MDDTLIGRDGSIDIIYELMVVTETGNIPLRDTKSPSLALKGML